MKKLAKRDTLIENPLDRIEQLEEKVRRLETIALTAGAADQRYAALADGFGTETAAWLAAEASILRFPALVGFWPGSGTDGSGQMTDRSGNGNHLTNNNTATFNASGLVSYIEMLSASSQYFSHIDNPLLSVLGTESHIGNVNGLTLGGWFFDNPSGSPNAGLMSKWGATGVSGSYLLYRTGGTNVELALENSSGTLEQESASGFTSSAWHSVIGRWTHNSAKAVFVDGAKKESASSLTNLRNNTIAFQIGAWTAASRYVNGRSCLCFVCAGAVPDDYIFDHVRLTAPLFGLSITL